MTSEREKGETTVQISRRKFLKDSGLLLGSAGLSAVFMSNACNNDQATTSMVTQTQTQTVTVTLPSGESENAINVLTIALTINNQGYIIETKASTTLQELLRDQVGLLSPKDMCYGYGACASCSVIMNGNLTLSCMVLAVECDGADITTAEQVAVIEPKLVDAYIENHCMQCGYCTPGFLVTSKVLLDRTPKPTEADIREALAGNICRCGTYTQHIKAILEVAAKK